MWRRDAWSMKLMITLDLNETTLSSHYLCAIMVNLQ